MSAPEHRTVCSQPVGVHGPGSWEGHLMPCGRDSVARHPAVVERWDGICRWHLTIFETEPFGPEDVVPLRRPAVSPPAQSCPLCSGNGCEEWCGRRGGCEMAYAGPDSHKVCRACGGTGRGAQTTRTVRGGFTHESWCEADHLGWSCAAWRDREPT